MGFEKLLEKYRSISQSSREKGDRFERLMQSYLQTDPLYVQKLQKVWLWQEFPYKGEIGVVDTGIDMVGLTQEGEYWAIQCKCYQSGGFIEKASVDSFLATSSREFRNEFGHLTGFSHRLWISTTNKWGRTATDAIQNQNPPVTRLNLHDLVESPVDWEALERGVHGEAARSPKKTLRAHQEEALASTEAHFKTAERGKLIMACGTGKTFTSLRIAERATNGKGLILFLVPSIALLGQTLREWSADATSPLQAICICSDPAISKKRSKNEDSDSFSVVDLALPASTEMADILHQFQQMSEREQPGMTVVFSTYQSIDVIAQVQKELLGQGLGAFDMVICDEAHRTTGVSLSGQDESSFTKVHDGSYIRSSKRLYMTATPRLYSEDAKSKAAQADALLCSMDDSSLYGEEIYRIGFGEAVERNLLTDYKVLILTLNDKDVPASVQRMLSDRQSEISTDDASKLIGCINALSKQFLGDEGKTKASDPGPMRRAVAFCANIATSKKITEAYNIATDAYVDSLPREKREQMVGVCSKHMDGTMSAPARDELLSWLKEEPAANECRIITNVRVLSEGVDVPSLDAVLFLSARNSQVDVVQSVGRVMRRAAGKQYGYIIIPVVVPADVEANKALDDNERYKVVWTVLNALRAHDDRFNTTVNQIELNRKKPENILVGRPEYSFDGKGNPTSVHEPEVGYHATNSVAHQMALQFEQLQSVIFARLVRKVGNRRYWEDWARDVALIANRQIERIEHLIAEKVEQGEAFENFLAGLQKNINPSISEGQAVDMLAQHLITKPIFEALFEGYSFVQSNAVSAAMQRMVESLQGESIAEESETLQRFYDSVRKRAEGIDNAEGKQRIIIELYDKFFKTAFPKMVEQLGIVYTPVEVVDFVIHSVNAVLQREFKRSIADENIHILDPFTGTGTFITRLLQSGLIDGKNLARKYHEELHANEIVLLAYYIAAVNIENAYHDQLDEGSAYEAFDGIVLTDTFQLGETDESQKLFSEMFPQNSARVVRQKKAPLRVIMGNPPYSVGQKSANDNAQNQKYEKLDGRIASTYAKATEATNKNSLYDSYIKAFRWSTDRLDAEHGGVIAFVSNGAWVDGNSADGFRKTLEKEFSSIWVLNLRGNARTQGELRQKEAGNVFGSGSRTPIAITLLVKKPSVHTEKAAIYYHDIGDYLSREEKLAKVSAFASIANKEMAWLQLQPNEHGDWLNKRNTVFETFIPIESGKKFNTKTQSFFIVNSRGVETARDAWVYNSSIKRLSTKIQEMIGFYNSEVKRFNTVGKGNNKVKVADFIDKNPQKISWSSSLISELEKGRQVIFERKKISQSLYRPFFKQSLYYGAKLIHRRGQFREFFPNPSLENIVICVSGIGGNKDNTTIITNCIPDLNCLDAGTQCFPLYYYEKREKDSPNLFDEAGEGEYIRHDGISDFILERARKQYGLSKGARKTLGKEDIFYYVYGFLHSPEYRTAFANDLKKMLPRLPLVEDVRDFWKFSKAGRHLAELHLGYETVPPYAGVRVTGAERGFFTVEKMRFPKKNQKDSIVYNSQIVVWDIPAKAYEYVVNGKSAIEWVMERYAVTTHKESGITNNPNDWSEEVGNPRYILDLLLSVINVSVQTVEIVSSLPRVSFSVGEEK